MRRWWWSGDLRRHRLQRRSRQARRRDRLPGDDRGRPRGLPAEPALQRACGGGGGLEIFGAIDFSAALAKLAGEIGYRVTIVDAREAFLQSPRFSEHAEVVVDWPDRYLATRELVASDAVLVLTHDPKFDAPALTAALESGAGYIGALGSRRTQADRQERLRARGVTEDELARINSPCGLDVGPRTPAETAIAVLGEILALRAGKSGGRLTDASGPIHQRPAEAAKT